MIVHVLCCIASANLAGKRVDPSANQGSVDKSQLYRAVSHSGSLQSIDLRAESSNSAASATHPKGSLDSGMVSESSSLRAPKKTGPSSSIIGISRWCPDSNSKINAPASQPAEIVPESSSYYDVSGWLGVISLGYLGSTAAESPSISDLSDTAGPVPNKHEADFCPPVTEVWNALAGARAVNISIDLICEQIIDIAVSLLSKANRLNTCSPVPADQQR